MSNKKNNNLFAQILKMISSIISWVLLVLLVIIAGFLIYYFLSTNLCKSQGETCRPKLSLYTIISPSMEPTIKVYDVIFNITPESPDEIEVGDVITFHSTSKMYSSRIVTHRVIEKRTANGVTEFRTQGDANLSPDDTYVPYENLIGKVAFKIPQLGRLQFLLTSAGGWLLIVIIPALLLIIFDVLKLVKLLGAKSKVTTVIDKEQTKIAQDQEEKEERQEKLRSRLIRTENDKYVKNPAEPLSIYTMKKTRINIELLENEKELFAEGFEDQVEEVIESNIISEISDVEETITANVVSNASTEEIIPSASKQPSMSDIMARINSIADEEEVEMPKMIALKEETIPDDIDLPTVSGSTSQSNRLNSNQKVKKDNKVVDIVVAKKKDKEQNQPIKVVGQVNKGNSHKRKNKKKKKRK